MTGRTLTDTAFSPHAKGLVTVKIIAVSMVKNEEDIIELIIRNLFSQGIDEMIVSDNMSSDGTRGILDRLAVEFPITVLDDLDPAYHQSRKMTALAHLAGAAGADWIVPFDADELWRGTNGTIRDMLAGSTAGVAAAPMLEHHPRPTLRRGGLLERMPWARHLGYAKVAFRWNENIVLIDGNHNVENAGGPLVWDLLTVHHFPMRSFKQWQRKALQGAAAVELADWPADMAPVWRTVARSSRREIRMRWWLLRLELKLRYRPI